MARGRRWKYREHFKFYLEEQLLTLSLLTTRYLGENL
jgi:hypothetical protein